jgi:hypothetical protein
MMTIAYENSTEDAIAVNVYRISHILTNQHKNRKRSVRILCVVAVLIAMLSLAVSLLTNHLRTENFLLLFFAFFLAILSGVYYSPRFWRTIIRMQKKGLTQSGAFRSDIGPRQVSVQPDGLLSIQPGASDLLLRWNAIEQIEVGERHLFMTWAAQQVLAIPRRAFVDAPQEESFLALIDQYCTATATGGTPTAPTHVGEAPWYHSRHGVDVETPSNVNRAS